DPVVCRSRAIWSCRIPPRDRRGVAGLCASALSIERMEM
ncbi:MAG: hypothetical protein AVDCRST_MAG62-243, partial [uncultured Sphingomonas sp.]